MNNSFNTPPGKNPDETPEVAKLTAALSSATDETASAEKILADKKDALAELTALNEELALAEKISIDIENIDTALTGGKLDAPTEKILTDKKEKLLELKNKLAGKETTDAGMITALDIEETNSLKNLEETHRKNVTQTEEELALAAEKLPVPEYADKIGVRVVRSNGDIETDWVVAPFQNGLNENIVIVEKKEGENITTKRIPLDKLALINKDIAGKLADTKYNIQVIEQQATSTAERDERPGPFFIDVENEDEQKDENGLTKKERAQIIEDLKKEVAGYIALGKQIEELEKQIAEEENKSIDTTGGSPLEEKTEYDGSKITEEELTNLEKEKDTLGTEITAEEEALESYYKKYQEQEKRDRDSWGIAFGFKKSKSEAMYATYRTMANELNKKKGKHDKLVNEYWDKHDTYKKWREESQERARLEALAQDRKDHPLRNYIFDQMHPGSKRFLNVWDENKIEVKDIADNISEEEDKIAVFSYGKLLPGRQYAAKATGNGFGLCLENNDELEDTNGAFIDGWQEKAKWRIIGPKHEVVANNLNFEDGEKLLKEKAHEYQKEIVARWKALQTNS